MRLMIDGVLNPTAAEMNVYFFWRASHLHGDRNDQKCFLETTALLAAGRWFSSVHFAAQLHLLSLCPES
jgi:hypothetical protein